MIKEAYWPEGLDWKLEKFLISKKIISPKTQAEKDNFYLNIGHIGKVVISQKQIMQMAQSTLLDANFVESFFSNRSKFDVANNDSDFRKKSAEARNEHNAFRARLENKDSFSARESRAAANRWTLVQIIVIVIGIFILLAFFGLLSG